MNISKSNPDASDGGSLEIPGPILRFIYKAIILQLIIVSLGAVLSIFVTHLPNFQLFSNYSFWVSIYAFLITSLLLIIRFKYPHRNLAKHIAKTGKAKMFVAVSVFPFVSVFLFQATIFESAPYLTSLVSGKEGSVTVTIKSTFAHRKLCGSGFTIEEVTGLYLFDTVCGINALLQRTLNEGDQVRVYGNQTPLGIQPQNIELVK